MGFDDNDWKTDLKWDLNFPKWKVTTPAPMFDLSFTYLPYSIIIFVIVIIIVAVIITLCCIKKRTQQRAWLIIPSSRPNTVVPQPSSNSNQLGNGLYPRQPPNPYYPSQPYCQAVPVPYSTTGQAEPLVDPNLQLGHQQGINGQQAPTVNQLQTSPPATYLPASPSAPPYTLAHDAQHLPSYQEAMMMPRQ